MNVRMIKSLHYFGLSLAHYLAFKQLALVVGSYFAQGTEEKFYLTLYS